MAGQRDGDDEDSVRVSFDRSLAGKRVQADGGAEVSGQRAGSRESFVGTLTGRRMEQGQPPWRWLELGELTEKPEGFDDRFVWCEESYVYFEDG